MQLTVGARQRGEAVRIQLVIDIYRYYELSDEDSAWFFYISLSVYFCSDNLVQRIYHEFH
jgi:hypothetical protein